MWGLCCFYVAPSSLNQMLRSKLYPGRFDSRQRSCTRFGWPSLALDQAGAYIEETGCSITDYLDCYQDRRIELLNLRCRFSTITHNPSLPPSPSHVKESRNGLKTPAELLRLCAFLHPDAIPKAMLIEVAPCLGSILTARCH